MKCIPKEHILNETNNVKNEYNELCKDPQGSQIHYEPNKGNAPEFKYVWIHLLQRENTKQ